MTEPEMFWPDLSCLTKLKALAESHTDTAKLGQVHGLEKVGEVEFTVTVGLLYMRLSRKDGMSSTFLFSAPDFRPTTVAPSGLRGSPPRK